MLFEGGMLFEGYKYLKYMNLNQNNTGSGNGDRGYEKV